MVKITDMLKYKGVMHLKLSPLDFKKHDKHEVSSLIYQADPSTYEILFGEKALAIENIMHLLSDTERETIFSKPHVKVIEDNDTLIGVLVNYTGARRQELESNTFKQGFKQFGFFKAIQRFFAIRKIRRILRVDMDLESTYILTLSIKADFQQQGYGEKTIDLLQKSSKTLYLHVNYKNNDARKFYEKIGFKKHQEFYDNYKKTPIGAIVLKRSQQEIR